MYTNLCGEKTHCNQICVAFRVCCFFLLFFSNTAWVRCVNINWGSFVCLNWRFHKFLLRRFFSLFFYSTWFYYCFSSNARSPFHSRNKFIWFYCVWIELCAKTMVPKQKKQSSCSKQSIASREKLSALWRFHLFEERKETWISRISGWKRTQFQKCNDTKTKITRIRQCVLITHSHKRTKLELRRQSMENNKLVTKKKSKYIKENNSKCLYTQCEQNELFDSAFITQLNDLCTKCCICFFSSLVRNGRYTQCGEHWNEKRNKTK